MPLSTSALKSCSLAGGFPHSISSGTFPVGGVASGRVLPSKSEIHASSEYPRFHPIRIFDTNFCEVISTIAEGTSYPSTSGFPPEKISSGVRFPEDTLLLLLPEQPVSKSTAARSNIIALFRELPPFVKLQFNYSIGLPDCQIGNSWKAVDKRRSSIV